MAVKLITDSGADISAAEAAELEIILVPMTIHFGKEEFHSGVDLSAEDFYTKLGKSVELPTTSQPTPAAFQEEYYKIKEAGDEAVVVCISSALSGTYQSAVIAAEDYSDCIHIVDTKNVTLGQRILVMYARTMINEGFSAGEIARKLLTMRSKVCVYGVLDTLIYLIKGGRLSKAAGFVGSIMGIRPLLTVNEDGELEVVGKARGQKAALSSLDKLLLKNEVDFSLPAAVGYTGLNACIAEDYVCSNTSALKDLSLSICAIGSTIGTHTGPGALALAFFKKI